MSELNQTTQPKPSSARTALWVSGVAVFIALFSSTLAFQSRFCAAHQLQALKLSFTELSQQQNQKISALKNKIVQMEDSQHMQVQKTAAQVSYLVGLANLHLAVGHDLKTAGSTLTLAQQELASTQNPAFSNVKQALASDIAALSAAPDVHTHQLFAEIATINNDIQNLSSIPTQPAISLQNTIDKMKSTDANLPWYKRALESAKQLKNLFVIRHLDKPNTPILERNLEMDLKQTIAVQLNMTQWALLHRDATIYQSTLQTVSNDLTQYFSLSDAKNPIQNKLVELLKVQIDPQLPTLNNTMNALSAIKIETPQITAPTQATIQQPKIPSTLPELNNPAKPSLPTKPIIPTTNSAPVET